MSSYIVGASVWEQELYDYVSSHIDKEREIVNEYRDLAESAASPALRYLARMILDDELRHHQLFSDLANSIKTEAQLSGEVGPIPGLHGISGDRDHALAVTERFMRIERDDLDELRELGKRLKDVRDTTLWALVVKLMQDDTNKHLRILRFIKDRLRHPAS